MMIIKNKIKRVKEYEDPVLVNKQTIFVGNVPVDATQKDLKNLFSEYGKIKSVRLRNIIPLDPKKSKRVSFIRKQFHPLQKSLTAFIRFDDETQAQCAIALNGQLFKNHHLRVNMAQDKKTK